jgi:hypothetical protein
MMIGRPISMRKASTSEIGYYDRTFGPSPPAYQLRTCLAFIAGRAFGDGERKVRARCAVLRPPCGAEGDDRRRTALHAGSRPQVPGVPVERAGRREREVA